MKIRKTHNKRLVQITSISPGECFERGGHHYIKLADLPLGGVRLEDGRTVSFELGDLVTPVTAEVLVCAEVQI